MVAESSKLTLPSSIPLPTRLKIRNLYVFTGLRPSKIALEVGLNRKQVSNLILRNKWTQVRQASNDRIEAKALARAHEQVKEVVDAVGSLAEEASVKGLQRALEATEDHGEFAAKDFANWSAGSRSLVAIARQARGLDEKASAGALNAGDCAVSINMFFLPQSAKVESQVVAQSQEGVKTTQVIDV